jgi:tetratricopeptide (TPR) repeat protein
MAKKRRDETTGLDRLFELVDEAPAGLHDLDEPAVDLPRGLPEPLIELYARCDGGRFFHDTIVLAPAREVTMQIPGRWQFATVEATGLLYDGDGEFADNIFDEEGEIEPVVREKQLRLHLKRDPAAPGVRWRLAHALLDQGATEDARNEMEQVVADDPAFAWAWLDLARISEALGELKGAVDEARMAAESAEGVQHAQAGYFWSQVARLATQTGDEILRAEAATRTSMLAPTLKQAQIAGARESLEQGDTDSAKGLVDLLRAVWPRDLEVLELARRVEGN